MLLLTARISQAPSLPWDCIRTDPGWKQAWAAEQKAEESESIDGDEMRIVLVIIIDITNT